MSTRPEQLGVYCRIARTSDDHARCSMVCACACHQGVRVPTSDEGWRLALVEEREAP